MSVGDLLGPAGAVVGGMIGGPAGVAIGGSIGGALGQSMSAGDAADAQSEAAARSDATQRYMYDTTRADNMPALESRNWALNELKSRLSSPNLNVASEPGYKFGLDQGMQALNNQLGARGMRNSGAALKAATRYGEDYGST